VIDWKTHRIFCSVEDKKEPMFEVTDELLLLAGKMINDEDKFTKVLIYNYKINKTRIITRKDKEEWKGMKVDALVKASRNNSEQNTRMIILFDKDTDRIAGFSSPIDEVSLSESLENVNQPFQVVSDTRICQTDVNKYLNKDKHEIMESIAFFLGTRISDKERFTRGLLFDQETNKMYFIIKEKSISNWNKLRLEHCVKKMKEEYAPDCRLFLIREDGTGHVSINCLPTKLND
jgi:hypothetical protein